MRLLLVSLFASALFTSAATVVDRIAVIVGTNVIKASDVDRDLRLSQFLNQEPIDQTDAARRKSAQRLIEQELIRQEIRNGEYRVPTDQEVETLVTQVRRDRFGGSDARQNAGLTRYGVTPAELREHLRWQLTVLRFIDQRFRPGVLVTDEDVKAYYDQHRAELAKADPSASSAEAAGPKIRDILSGEQINQNFEQWLEQARRQVRVDYRDPTLRQGD